VRVVLLLEAVVEKQIPRLRRGMTTRKTKAAVVVRRALWLAHMSIRRDVGLAFAFVAGQVNTEIPDATRPE
jgi:hypothetical protein